jgi:hypothetical protein
MPALPVFQGHCEDQMKLDTKSDLITAECTANVGKDSYLR